MKKFVEFIKNHSVEILGFTVVLFLIIFISYLKYYKKTYTCELSSNEKSITMYEKYIVEQKNNKLKSIDYYYEAKAPNKEERNQIIDIYKGMLDKKSGINGSDITIKFDNDKLIFSYYLNEKEVTELSKRKEYKNARTFLKNIKSNGFVCK